MDTRVDNPRPWWCFACTRAGNFNTTDRKCVDVTDSRGLPQVIVEGVCNDISQGLCICRGDKTKSLEEILANQTCMWVLQNSRPQVCFRSDWTQVRVDLNLPFLGPKPQACRLQAKFKSNKTGNPGTTRLWWACLLRLEFPVVEVPLTAAFAETAAIAMGGRQLASGFAFPGCYLQSHEEEYRTYAAILHKRCTYSILISCRLNAI